MQLVKQAKKGDRKAMDDLLGSIRRRCLAVALRVLHNFDDAQDALQDAFLKIWKNLSTFEGRSSFATWTHRIVLNACLDMMRRDSNQPLVSNEFDPITPSIPSVDLVFMDTPEDIVANKQRLSLVHDVMSALPVVHKQVIKLRDFDDLSYDEMSKIMDCPIGTVMSRIHHARIRLATALSALPCN
jgi:RNA polymerase sigma-70 factor (ECF subfamily)